MYEYECKVFFQLVEVHNTHTIRGYCFGGIVVAKPLQNSAIITFFNGVQWHLKFPELLRVIRYMIISHVLLQHRNGERASPAQ